jgi:hypothetical protein
MMALADGRLCCGAFRRCQLTPWLLPNRPKPAGFQEHVCSQYLFRPQAPGAMRPVGLKAAEAAGTGNSFDTDAAPRPP